MGKEAQKLEDLVPLEFRLTHEHPDLSSQTKFLDTPNSREPRSQKRAEDEPDIVDGKYAVIGHNPVKSAVLEEL